MAEVQNAIRLPDGTEVVFSEWLHQPLFSTIEFAGNAGVNLYAFNYVKGGTVSSAGIAQRQATEADTNVVKRKGMAQDEAIVVFAITFDLYSLNSITANGTAANPVSSQPAYNDTALKVLQRDAVVELRVGAGIKKPQVGVPFSWLAQSIGSPATISGTAAADGSLRQYGTSGEISADNQRLLKLPVYIGGYGETQQPGNAMKFDFRFFNPRGTFAGMPTNGAGGSYNTRIRFWLDGLRKRPL